MTAEDAETAELGPDDVPEDLPVEFDDEIFTCHDVERGPPTDFEESEMIAKANTIKWHDVKNATRAKATVAVAIEAGWTQAKDEFNFVRDKMKQRCGSNRPKIGEIVDLIFGPRSAVYQAFFDEGIVDDNETFMRFLVAFLLCCSYQVSCKQLYDKYSRISKEGALEKSQYIEVWKRIGNASVPSKADRNKSTTPTGMVPFWMKLETAFNEYSRSLFLEGYNGSLHITIDDDKAHFSGTKYTAGLKVVRHVKDNRNGHTLHTMVHSSSQIPVQVAWERQHNDSAETCTERCFSNGITPMAAPGSAGDLRHCNVAMDRGHWSKDLLHEYFMRSGAKITAGTAKRQHCIPMTYGQKLLDSDGRSDIPTTGPKTVFIKETTSYGRKLYCHAYRNGTGGVTLGLSTEHGQDPEWELVLASPSDLAWYDSPTPQTAEQKIRRCFRVLLAPCYEGNETKGMYEEMAPEFLKMIDDIDVQPLTTAQGTPEWFLLRKFSLTSSISDKAIASCDGTEKWLSNPIAWQKIKSVLSKVFVPPPANEEIEVAATEAPELQAPPNQAEANQEQQPEENPPTQDNSDEAAVADEGLTLEKLLADEAMIELAKNQVSDDELDLVAVRKILVALGHKLSKATKKDAADIKTFSTWLNVAPQLRPHYFKKPTDLITVAKSLSLDVSSHGTKKESLRTAINEWLLLHPDATVADDVTAKKPTAKEQRKAIMDALSDQQTLACTVIKASYLEPLTGKAKKHTRRGHQLECHIMKSCIEEHVSRFITTPLIVKKACTAPLVEKTAQRYIRGSIDFLAVATVGDTGNDKLIGVEIKARVGLKREQEEAQHVEKIRRLFGKDRTPTQRKVKYFEVSAAADEFPLVVASTHEAVQVLHHAIVYDLDHVLLLVGDNNGNVLCGIFVSVDQSLRESYGSVLKDIYTNSLRWIYEEDAAPLADEELAQVLQVVQVNGASVDRHSFDMDVALWKDINSNMDFPLPRLARIIPLVHAFWNSIKGGSDATSNLIWHCIYSVPSDENQSIAVARFMSLSAVHVHRLLQLSSAKDDLNTYPTLKAFRDAATQRTSFKKSLNRVVDHLTNLLKGNEPEQMPPQTGGIRTPVRINAGAVAAAERGAARVRRSQKDVEHVRLQLIETNKTPKRNVANKLEQMEAKMLEGKLDAQSSLVVLRSKGCTGFAVWCVGDEGIEDSNGTGARGTCAICKTQTHNYCLGCKRWMCSTVTAAAKKLPGWKNHIVINPESDSPIHSQANCFFVGHRAAQERAIKEFNAVAMGSMLKK